MEGITPLGPLDPQHAIAQLVKALAQPAACWMPKRSTAGVQEGTTWQPQPHKSFSVRRRRNFGFPPPTARHTH